jgi:hypothetical protein
MHDLQAVQGSEPDEALEFDQQRQRAPKRPRTSRPLPTDRLKFPMQVAALKAIAVASNYGERGVSADDLAPRIGVSAATAGLNNAFFLEAGVIVRERKGHYLPTDATSEFARRSTFNETEAAALLADAFKETWYFREVAQQLGMGPTSHEQMTQVLAHAAGASKAHETQLTNVLLWLEYVGLILLFDGKVQLGQRDIQDLGRTPPPLPETPEPAPEPAPSPGPAESERPTTTRRQKAPTETVLSLSFDFAVTAEELSGLSADQITALFEAVGKVAAIKATTHKT